MNRFLFSALLLPLVAAAAPAQFGNGPRDFAAVVKRVEATIEPSNVKRGETVTWRLTVELIPGWHTYPTIQPEEAAASYVNQITPLRAGGKLAEDGPVEPVVVAFVGPLKQPADPIKSAEPPDVKQLHSYVGEATWDYTAVVVPNLKPGIHTVKVPVRILACDDNGCLPPKHLVIETQLTVSDAPPVAIDPKYVDAVKAILKPPAPVPVATSPAAGPVAGPRETTAKESISTGEYTKALTALEAQVGNHSVAPQNTGLGAFLVTAVAWGLVSLVTPCVFPMIPITVSFFLKQSEKQQINPLLQALVYCGTIVVVLGVAALTLLSVFRALSVNPIANVLLGLLFVVLALSLFGMFELTLPNSLTRWSSSREGRGGLVGTVFMALTFTIVSFTCVAPFLGGFAGIVDSGRFQWWEMLTGALAFSGAFAAPFFLLALFPSMLRKLPRSGGWLNSVKVVMGFLEIAAALVFFRTAELPSGAHFFSYDLVLGMWIALAILCGLYLINVFRLGHDEPLESVSVPRFLFGFMFCGLGLYLLPGLFMGANGERHRPGGVVFAWVDAFLLPETSTAPGELQWTADLPRAVVEARKERERTGKRQLVFVDFTGVTCKNCKYNEQNIFSKADVKDLFRPYRLVQMYTDTVPELFYARPTAEGQRQNEALANLGFQRRKFGTEQLPLYVILEPQADGSVTVVDVYDEGKINQVDRFVEFLKRPVAAETGRAQAK
jgi:thiol:disulfide interchange protein DsbD